MFPELLVRPRAPEELLALTLALVGALACLTMARRARGDKRIMGTFAGYLLVIVALMLGIHAATAIAPLSIRGYSVMMLVAYLGAWTVAYRDLRRGQCSLGFVMWLLVGAVVIGLVGGRIGWMIGAVVQGEIVELGILMDPKGGGFAVLGGISAYLTFVAVLHRFYPEYPLLDTMDRGTVAAGVLVTGIRIGCLLEGCCHGVPTSWAGPGTIAVSRFAAGSPVARTYGDSPQTVLWATQAIEASAVAAITAMCWFMIRRRISLDLGPGTIAATALIAYSTVRIAMDEIRTDAVHLPMGVTLWQLGGIMLIGGTSICVALVRHRSVRARYST